MEFVHLHVHTHYSMQSSPVFRFQNMGDMGKFLVFAIEHAGSFPALVSEMSSYARIQDIKYNIEVNQLIVNI